MKTPNVNISITYAVMTDGTRFVAVAPHLNIVGFGKTSEAAISDFDLAVKSFIQFHTKNKNLDAKLINLGWQLYDHKRIAPHEFSVPTGILESSRIQSTASKMYTVA